jgi:hypothetical protein
VNIYATGLQSSSYRISLTNVLGQVWENKEMNALKGSFHLELNTRYLQKGIYFLIISNGNSSYSKKIIKD